MLVITVEIAANTVDAQGVKERLAMDFERYGNVRITDIKEIPYVQTKMEGLNVKSNNRYGPAR